MEAIIRNHIFDRRNIITENNYVFTRKNTKRNLIQQCFQDKICESRITNNGNPLLCYASKKFYIDLAMQSQDHFNDKVNWEK